uniref:CRAL/TRIO N-terminal domain-containing protein n=1 Tax=Daphnia galeata TaxID=27404 RepID=A0A8J2RY61_9CRUS|nr:unnamed protein product [Daphnia galeata]
MESTLDQLDEPSKRALLEFKERIQDCMSKMWDTRDEHLLKWLIARHFSVTEAEKMLRASLVWRQANGIDEISKWNPPEVLLKYFSYGKVGYDKLNSPGQYLNYLNIGGQVPYSYYMSNSAPVVKDYMETMNLIAGAGGFKKLKYKIDVAYSVLR